MLLDQRHQVVVLDILPSKVSLINEWRSPIADEHLADYLARLPLNLRATSCPEDAYAAADFVIIATPTNHDPVTHRFNTESELIFCPEFLREGQALYDINPFLWPMQPSAPNRIRSPPVQYSWLLASGDRLSKRVSGFKKAILTVPTGPFRCLAMMTSAMPGSFDSLL